MRKIGAIVGVLVLTAVIANGAVIPDGKLKLVIQLDGTASIINQSGTWVEINAYEIYSGNNRLNVNPSTQVFVPTPPPGHYNSVLSYDPASGWAGLAISNSSGHLNLLSATGAYIEEPAGWNITLNTAQKITETNSTAGGGMYFSDTNLPFPLGKLITNPVKAVDEPQLTFVYVLTSYNGGVAGNVYSGPVQIVPEPATMSLLAIGGIAMLVRRRRR